MKWPWQKRREERDINKMDLWRRGLPMDAGSDAGVHVNRDTATRVVAVYASVRLRAEAIAGLPADAFRRQGPNRVEIDPPQWVRRPNPEQTWFEFIERVNTSLDLDGNAYILISARDRLLFPAETWVLHPDQVEPRRRDGTGELFFQVTADDRAVPLEQRVRELTPFDPDTKFGQILHIKNVSWGQDKAPSPIGVARQAIGLALASEQQGSRFFGSGQTLSGVITLPPQEGSKSRQFVDEMKEYWLESHGGSGRSHLPGIMTGGATWTPITMSNEDAQFLETRKFQVTEIARLYGVPPHLIGDVERSTSWGSGIEQQGIGFVVYSLGGRINRLEAAFEQLLPRGQFLKLKPEGLMRGDSAARASYYQAGIQAGWLLRSEARALEDLPPEPGIDDVQPPAAEVPSPPNEDDD